jgi:hypothetical protein
VAKLPTKYQKQLVMRPNTMLDAAMRFISFGFKSYSFAITAADSKDGMLIWKILI